MLEISRSFPLTLALQLKPPFSDFCLPCTNQWSFSADCVELLIVGHSSSSIRNVDSVPSMSEFRNLGIVRA